MFYNLITIMPMNSVTYRYRGHLPAQLSHPGGAEPFGRA
jgi:hypothetical protein